jgi:hypothetical protein
MPNYQWVGRYLKRYKNIKDLHRVKGLFVSHIFGIFNFPLSKVGTPECTKGRQWRNKHGTGEFAIEPTGWFIDGASKCECVELSLEGYVLRSTLKLSIFKGLLQAQYLRGPSTTDSYPYYWKMPCHPGQKFQYFIESILQWEVLFFPLAGASII